MNTWAETERDPDVNYAILEQNESEESGRGYPEGIKMVRRWEDVGQILPQS